MSSDIEQHEISLDSPLSLPPEYVYHRTPEAAVIIYPELVRWLVLKENLSTDILKLLTSGATPLNVIAEQSKIHPVAEVEQAFDKLMIELIDKGIWPQLKSSTDFFPEYKVLTLTLTNACNLRCTTCYRFCGSREPSELSEQRWHEILDEFISHGGEVLRISGGEPLFQHKNLTLELIRRASKNELKTLLLTNGTLLDKNTVKKLVDAGLNRIQISLDGPDQVSNDSVRGQGVFRKVTGSVKYLKKTSIELFIAVVPLPGISLEALERDGKKFFNDLKKVLGRPLTVSIAQGILEGRSVERKDDIKFIRRCRNLQDQVSDNKTSAGLDLWQWEPGQKNSSCGIGCSLAVEPNGDVRVCAGGEIVCNLQNKGLETAISALRKTVHANTVDSLAECLSCNLRYLCGGPCRIDNKKCTEETRSEILRRLIAMNELRYDPIL